jgi:hypothetical protein
VGKVLRRKRIKKLSMKRVGKRKSRIRMKINQFMLAHREYFDGKRVIDFGCGPNKQYKNFYDYREYIPIDPVLDGTDICKKMESRGDCGICISVLSHVIDPVSALKNMKECIGTGYFILSVSVRYVLLMLPSDYYRFTPEFWRVVESCGFEVIEKVEITGRGLDGRESSMLTMFCKGRDDAKS